MNQYDIIEEQGRIQGIDGALTLMWELILPLEYNLYFMLENLDNGHVPPSLAYS